MSANGQTNWANRTLRTGARAICLDCNGSGKHGTCGMCNGKGVVCPSCHGMRFLRMRQRGHEWASASDLTRCPDCCEGNQINELREVACIRRYIALADAMPDAAPDVEQGTLE